MPERTALCVSSLHRTPLARYPAIRQQPACPFAREFDHRRTQRSGTCPSPGPLRHTRGHRLPVRSCWSSRSSSPPPASSRSRRRPRARRRPSGSDRRAASSTDPAPGRPERSSRPARALAGDAQFTYDIPVIGNNGESGTWSFFTTAGANGTVPVPYHWTGLHAWFNVTARLDAVVVRGASLVSTTNLVNAGPESCCTTPSNGFDYAGTANFTVQTGDKYGFVLRGSNGDFNDFLRGELTIGTVVPTSMRRCPGPLRLLRRDRRPLRHPPRRRPALHRPLRRHGHPGRRQGLSRGPKRTRRELRPVRRRRRCERHDRHDLVHEGSARPGQPDGGRERHTLRDEHRQPQSS